MLQTVQAHLGSHSSKYGSCCISSNVFYLSDCSQSLDAHRIANLNITFTICLSLVLCIPQCCCSLFLILFLFSLALGMALFALLNLGYLAGNFVIGLLGINFLNLLLEGIKFLTDTAGFFFSAWLSLISRMAFSILLLLSFRSSAASSFAFLRIAFLLRSISSMSFSYLEIVFSMSFSR